MKAPKASDFLTNEQTAIENAAISQAGVLEGASVFALAVEKCQFPKDVEEEVQKNIKRAINAAARAVPNQWKQRVLEQLLSGETDILKQRTGDEDAFTEQLQPAESTTTEPA